MEPAVPPPTARPAAAWSSNFIYGLLAGALVADLLLPFVAWGDPPEIAYACLWGFLLGQAGLVSGWAALGPGRALPRVARTAGLGVTAVACFLSGLTFSTPAVSGREFPGEIVLWCPLAFIVLTAPLWLVRYLGNWRIVHVNQTEPASTSGRQYGTGHLLACTAVVAAALGLSRAAAAASGEEYTEMLLIALVALAILALLVAISILPGVRCLLSGRSGKSGLALLGASAIVMCGVVFIVCAAIEACFARPQGSALHWLRTVAEDVGPIILGIVVTGYATVGFGVSAWRLAGYRLARGKVPHG